jgi:hypothetical protein
MLAAAIGKSREAVDALREKYQSARLKRRQVETSIDEAEAAEALDAGRRSQQALDDWYGSRRQVAMAAASRPEYGVEERKHEGESNGRT